MTTTPDANTRFLSRRPRLTDLLAPLLVLMLVVAVWQAAVSFGRIHPILLPSPIAVAQAAWKIRSDLFNAAGRTALAATAGLALSVLAGTLTAFVFSQSGLIRRALYPYAVLLQTIPIIAIAPIVIVTFGRGFFSITLVAGVISLFPIITSTTTGLLQIDPNLLDLFRLNRATRLQTLIKLRVPSSLPYLLSGIRIASGAANPAHHGIGTDHLHEGLFSRARRVSQRPQQVSRLGELREGAGAVAKIRE